jgi:molecular chaperone DnaK
MAADNKTLGQFELVGIPPAPRGIPQIEVSFDIDANGIVHVSAKDLGTGKEQSIKITASSGLKEEEIKKMVRDAEAHAADDKKRRGLAEARNQLDSLIYTTEKSLKEFGDKIDSAEKQNIEDAIAKAKKAMETNDLETLKSAQEELTRSSHKLAEAMYSKAAQGAKGAKTGPESGAQEGPRPKAQEDVVDADFEDVKEKQ